MFRATLNWNELRDIARLYSTLPAVFTENIWERLTGLLHILWPTSEDVPANEKKRKKLASKFIRRLDTHEPLPGEFPNTNPFNAHVRAIVRFDLFAQNCIKAKVNPFQDEEFKALFPDLTLKQFGRWIQGSVPDCHCEAVNSFFSERLGQDFDPFWPSDTRLSDNTLLALGYLCVPWGNELCQRDYWSGDRAFPGADKRLLITNLCRGLPLFYWLKTKKWKYNPRTQEFVIVDEKFNHQWWLTTCSRWAGNRFRYWELRQRLLVTLNRIDSYREKKHERQIERNATW